MLVQKSRALIRKLPDLILPGGDRTWLADAPVGGPASPLERDRALPKGWRNRDSGGVGLGIVAALENAAAPTFHVSAPITINSPRTTGLRSCAGAPEPGCTGGRCTATSVCCHGEEAPAFPTADFLSHCYLCGKRLHGKDIYMYRGEKAFCSMECRYRQIVSDEYQEKCWSEATKTTSASADVSSSPYSGGKLFFTGIAAA